MAGETLLITELTGSERSVELRDRTLPYRPVDWGGEAKHSKRVYPGNPVATIQMLGPEETDTRMKGKWKTRYIGTMATTNGFNDVFTDLIGDAVVTAESLVQVFHQLRISGNMLEVRWGPEVRRGILASFSANYDRVEDIGWTANFVWSQIGEDEAPRAPDKVTDPQVGIENSLANLEDLMAQLPPLIMPNITGPLIFAEEAMRIAAMSMTASLANVTGVPTVTTPQFQGIASLSTQMGVAARPMIRQASDQSIEDWIATDFVGDQLTAETFRHDLAVAARALWIAALAARESIRARVVDDYMATVTARQGWSLRRYALRYYGDADSWTTIADANGLTSATVTVGTVLVIPRRSRSRGAAA